MITPPTAEVLKQYRLHTLRVGPLLFGARQSDDGLWHLDGRILPWVFFLPWSRGEGGGCMKIGGWMLGVMWRRADER